MLAFIFLLLYRAASGLQNGLGYGKKKQRIIGTAFLVGATIFTDFYLNAQPLPVVAKFAGYTLSIIAAVAAILVEVSFWEKAKGNFFDIHFWESITTSFITMAWICTGGNLIMIICSVYPGLILHKGFVNIFHGHQFFYQGTNDPTGRTFSLPLFGTVVYRGSNTWRWMLTGFSIVAAIMTVIFDWKITVFPLVIDLFGNA